MQLKKPVVLAIAGLLVFSVLCWLLFTPAAHDPNWWRHVGIAAHRSTKNPIGGDDRATSPRRKQQQRQQADDAVLVDSELIMMHGSPAGKNGARKGRGAAPSDDAPFELKEGVHYVADYNVSTMAFRPPKTAPDIPPKFHYLDPYHPPLNYTVKIVSEEPIAFFIPDFLTDKECNDLIAAAKPSLFRSLVLAPGQGGHQAQDEVRTSKQTWLSTTYGPAASVAERLLKFTGFPRGTEEQMQILHYEVGQKYDAHNDYFDPAMYGPQSTNRALTVFLYLNDVEEGGETWFPRASGKGPTYEYKKYDRGLRVRPVKRSIVMFYGMRPDATYDATSLHGGCPVIKGEKWGGTLWFRINTK